MFACDWLNKARLLSIGDLAWYEFDESISKAKTVFMRAKRLLPVVMEADTTSGSRARKDITSGSHGSKDITSGSHVSKGITSGSHVKPTHYFRQSCKQIHYLQKQ